MNVHRVWFPLYDTPVTLSMSREQLQIVTDVLKGDLASSRPSWRGYIAEQFDKVLADSLGEENEPAELDHNEQEQR